MHINHGDNKYDVLDDESNVPFMIGQFKDSHNSI